MSAKDVLLPPDNKKPRRNVGRMIREREEQAARLMAMAANMQTQAWILVAEAARLKEER
jgi:hypothetical protein